LAVFRAGFLGFQMRYQGLKLGDPAGRSIDRSLFSGRVVRWDWSSVVCRYRFDGPFSESVLEGDLMAAVIGSIKEDWE
jgi:hypothetical protein